MNVLVQEIYDRIFEYRREDLFQFLKEEKKLNEKQIKCILGIRSRLHNVSYPGFFRYLADFIDSDRDLGSLSRTCKLAKGQTRQNIEKRYMEFELLVDNLESLKAFRDLLPFVDKDMLSRERKKRVEIFPTLDGGISGTNKLKILKLHRQIFRLLVQKGWDINTECESPLLAKSILLTNLLYMYERISHFTPPRYLRNEYRDFIREVIDAGGDITSAPLDLFVTRGSVDLFMAMFLISSGRELDEEIMKILNDPTLVDPELRDLLVSFNENPESFMEMFKSIIDKKKEK